VMRIRLYRVVEEPLLSLPGIVQLWRNAQHVVLRLLPEHDLPRIDEALVGRPPVVARSARVTSTTVSLPAPAIDDAPALPASAPIRVAQLDHHRER
jgi:hypothetical protein